MSGITPKFLILFLVISKINSSDLQLSITAQSQSNFALNEPFQVSCQLDPVNDKDQPSGSVFFFCPYAPDGSQFCLQNCINICEGLETCRNKRKIDEISCEKRVNTQDGSITYEYAIPKLTERWNTEEFYCKHRNSISEKVRVQDLKHALFLKKQDLLEEKQKEEIKISLENSDISVEEKLVLPSVENIEAQLPSEGFPEIKSSRKAKATILSIPTEIFVIIFITCLCLSILLNVFCCLRCVLIKHYSKNLNSVSMQEFFCMKKEIFLARHFQKTTNGIMDSFVTKHYPLLTMPPNNTMAPSNTTNPMPNTNNFIYSCQKDLARVPEYTMGPVTFYPEAMQCCSPRSENSSNVSNTCHRYLSEPYNHHQKLSDSGISMNHQNNLQIVQDMQEKSDTYTSCKDERRNSKLYLIPKSVQECSMSRSTLRPEDSMTIQSDPMNKGPHIHQYPAASVEYSGYTNPSMDNQPLLFIQNEEMAKPLKSSAYFYNESLMRRNKTNSFRGGDVQSETLERKSLILAPICRLNPTVPSDEMTSSKSSILYFYPNHMDLPKPSTNDLPKSPQKQTHNDANED